MVLFAGVVKARQKTRLLDFHDDPVVELVLQVEILANPN